MQQPERRAGRAQLVRVIAVKTGSLRERPHDHGRIPGPERPDAIGTTQWRAARYSGLCSTPDDLGEPARRQQRNGAISPNDQRPAVTLDAPGLRPDVVSAAQRLCGADVKLVARAQRLEDRGGQLAHGRQSAEHHDAPGVRRIPLATRGRGTVVRTRETAVDVALGWRQYVGVASYPDPILVRGS